MELHLSLQPDGQVAVACDGQPSHTFPPSQLAPTAGGPPEPLDDPEGYGRAIFAALFPADSPARQALDARPERILLVALDAALDGVPWEYACGPDGFVVLDVPFVRGLPAAQRIATPASDGRLHVVAVPSDPLDDDVPPLRIEEEWTRLAEEIQEVPGAVVLERVRPPTIDRLGLLLAGQRNRVVHFMGHGAQTEAGAALVFEQEHGAAAAVSAQQFVQGVGRSALLVTLNACVSATPGLTAFSNLAAALVGRRVPYALGMRFSIPDEDARRFARAFYSTLARGVAIEEALRQARLALSRSSRRWAVGVPVLYTALDAPLPGVPVPEGQPQIQDQRPSLEVASVLPRAEGAFRGRAAELAELGRLLTGDVRPRLITVHGAGGQGKSALAREAAERFGWAWPGGVVALSLESLPVNDQLLRDLARALQLDTGGLSEPEALERAVLARLAARRTLLILDNAETLLDAVDADNPEARELAALIRTRLSAAPTSVLLTTRRLTAWPGEEGITLGGLDPEAGARLFADSAPTVRDAIDRELELARTLSVKVAGHPLSLRLLGSAFNAAGLPLAAFLADHERHLREAENKYVDLDHRHRTLYASIETSVRFLPEELRGLLSGLWVFHAPFLSEAAVAIFDPEHDLEQERSSPVDTQLHALWMRGLLLRIETMHFEGVLLRYQLLPTVRPYVEHHLSQAHSRDTLLMRFAVSLLAVVRLIYSGLSRDSRMAVLALQGREDLERGRDLLEGEQQGEYLMRWGWVLHRLGDRRRARIETEAALEALQGGEQALFLSAINNLAQVYAGTGQPERARALYEQALLIQREVGDRAGEAATLSGLASMYAGTGQLERARMLSEEALPLLREMGNSDGEAATLSNLAGVYRSTGEPERARGLYERALLIQREGGDRAGEAATLSNLALVYRSTGQPKQALALLEEALPIQRELGYRAGEAVTLNNLAGVYEVMGQLEQAQALYEQALKRAREVSDRAGEAATLNNQAVMYRSTGQLERAQTLYEQALPIFREVGDRAGEAATLNNLGVVYGSMGQLKRARALCEQALERAREVGDRTGEAAALNGLASLLMEMQHFSEALEVYTQCVVLERQVQHPAGEIAGRTSIAFLLHQHLGRSTEALEHLDQALAVFARTGLLQDAAGQTPEQVRQVRTMIQQAG